MNAGFTKRIIGLKDEESDAILQLLFKVGVILLDECRLNNVAYCPESGRPSSSEVG